MEYFVGHSKLFIYSSSSAQIVEEQLAIPPQCKIYKWTTYQINYPLQMGISNRNGHCIAFFSKEKSGAQLLFTQLSYVDIIQQIHPAPMDDWVVSVFSS